MAFNRSPWPQQPVLRRRSLILGTAMAVGMHGLHARQSAWPTKPIRIIAAQATGSSNDATARALADYLSQQLAVPVVVENRAGGVSMIAADHVARSAADGYTLLIALNSQLAQAPVLLKSPSINPDRDLLPIASLGVGPVTGVAHKDFPAQTMQDVIAYAKRQPVNVGNYAIGSGWQLMLSQVAKETGAQFNFINYRGTGAMLVDLYAGQVDIGAGSLAGIGGGIQQGMVKPLVVFTPNRSSRMPDVPTWGDLGFKGPAFDDLVESNVLYAPAGTPAAVVEQIAALVQRAHGESPSLKNLMETLAEEEAPLTGEALGAFIGRTWPSYRTLTRELGLAAD